LRYLPFPEGVKLVNSELTLDQVRLISSRFFGCHRNEVEITPVRTGLFNETFLASHSSLEVVVRIAPADDEVFCFYEKNMMWHEPAIHRMLLEKTTIPVPEIYVFERSRRLIDRDYLIMEKLPGSPASELMPYLGPAEVEAMLEQVGGYLAQCHRLHRESYGYLGPNRPMHPQPKWADAFTVMWNRLIDDVVKVGHYSGKEARRLRRLLTKHAGLFDRDIPASFLHMDVWEQNILCDTDGRVQGLLDWDRALWGDPEIEYAVLDYCGISKPAFWRGYGRSRPDGEQARLRNVFYLLYEVQKYIVIRAGRHHDRAGAQRYKAQVMDIVDRSGL